MAYVPDTVLEHQIIHAKSCWVAAIMPESKFKRKYPVRRVLKWRIGDTCNQIKILMVEREQGINFHISSTLVYGAMNIFHYQVTWFSSYLKECKMRLLSTPISAVESKNKKRTPKIRRSKNATDPSNPSVNEDVDDIPNVLDEDVIFMDVTEPIFPPVLPRDVNILEEDIVASVPDPTKEPGYIPSLTMEQLDTFLEHEGLPSMAEDNNEIRAESNIARADLSDALIPLLQKTTNRTIAEITPSKRRSLAAQAPETPSKRKRRSAVQLFGQDQPNIADQAPALQELQIELTQLEISSSSRAAEAAIPADDDLYHLPPVDEQISARKKNRRKKKIADNFKQIRPNDQLSPAYFERVTLSDRARKLDELQWSVRKLLSMPGTGWRSFRKYHRFNEKLLANFTEMILGSAESRYDENPDGLRMGSSTEQSATLDSNTLQVGINSFDQQSSILPTVIISPCPPVPARIEAATTYEESLNLPDTTELPFTDFPPDINLPVALPMDQEITTTDMSPDKELEPSPSSWTTENIKEKLRLMCDDGQETIQFKKLAPPESTTKRNAIKAMQCLLQLNKEDRVRLNPSSWDDSIYISLTDKF